MIARRAAQLLEPEAGGGVVSIELTSPSRSVSWPRSSSMSSWTTWISDSVVRWLEAIVLTRLSSASMRSLISVRSSSAACETSRVDAET